MVSGIIDIYTRAELDLLAYYVKEKDANYHPHQIQDPDMRIYPEALGLMGPGEIELNPYSRPINPNLTFETLKESVSAVPQSLVGRTLLACFEVHGVCHGAVTKFDKWLEVRYEDGDEEG